MTVAAKKSYADCVQTYSGGEIHLGEKVRIRGTHLPVELGSLPGGVLEIGDQTYINSGASICAQESVKIGAKCAIGNQALIMDTDFHSIGDHMQPGIAHLAVIEDDSQRRPLGKGNHRLRSGRDAHDGVIEGTLSGTILIERVSLNVCRSLTHKHLSLRKPLT